MEYVIGPWGVAESRYSLENPNLPLNIPAVWDEVFGTQWETGTGEKVSHARAMNYAAVHQAVQIISGDVAKLPLYLYKQSEAGIREAQETDWLTLLLSESPMPDTNAFCFWRDTMTQALIWGNAFIYVQRDAVGEPVELLPLLPDRTMMKRYDSGLWCITEADGKIEPIRAEDVLHIRGLTLDRINGIDWTQGAREAIALGLAQQGFASRFFKHGGRQGGILEIPANVSKLARDALEEGFRKSYEGTDNPFRTVILRDNAKFHAAQTSPADSQLVEATEQQVKQIARFFNLRPSKLGVSDSATSYNSKTEDNQDYLDTTLSHWTTQIGQECTLKLISAPRRRRLWIEHDTSNLLRMSPTAQAEYLQKMVSATLLSPNEARRVINMPPRDGGDVYGNPATSSPAVAPQQPTQDMPQTDAKQADTARVVFALGAAARHKAKNQSSFRVWLAGDMANLRLMAHENGVDSPWIDGPLAEFRAALDVSKPENLAEMVAKICLKYEKECLK